MKERLQRILPVLFVLALVLGCFAAAQAEGTAPAAQTVLTVEWLDDNNLYGLRPEKITVGGQELTMANGWTAVVPSGSAMEDLSARLYRSSADTVTGDIATVQYTFQNKPQNKVSFTGAIDWNDKSGTYETRPSDIQLQLLENGQPFGVSKTVNSTNGWSVTWNNLPANRVGSTEPAEYSVKQVEVPMYYRETGISISGNKATITNTVMHGTLQVQVEVSNQPEGADLSGLKLRLSGPDSNFPKILTYNEVIDDKQESKLLTFDVIPGTYLLEDINADTLVEGYLLQHSDRDDRIVDACQVKGYEYGDESTPIEPGKLSVNLVYVVPKPEDPKTLPDPNVRTGNLTFDILASDYIDDDRFPITGLKFEKFTDGVYTIDNVKPGSYTVVERNANELIDMFYLRSDSETGGSIMIKAGETVTVELYNHYVPAPTPEPDAETVDIPVIKSWNDNNNQDGNRPAEVTVRLYADGAQVNTVVLNEANGWRHTFEGLPRYKDDVSKTEINYSISEDAVPLYRTVIREYSIVNEYEPELVSAAVSKIWNDDGNATGQRPFNLAMSLMNGDEVVKVVILSDENGWTQTVNNLPAIVNGQRVTYTWIEQESLNYYLAAKAEDGNNAVFTNASWERPPVEEAKVPKKAPGNAFYIFDDYETPLGVEVMINHVGDCFD